MEVADKRRVRFYLVSEADFARFEEACKTELVNVASVRADVHPEEDDEDA
jgi:hypothetical protein